MTHVSTESTTIASTDGLSLEAVVDAPDAPLAALVLCHPHPQMGGTMNAPLLLALRDELLARRWAVVRFNFRGIGASEGESSTGVAEQQDANGAVAFAHDRWSVPVAIAGWSFGAAVAIRAAMTGDDLVACAAIAPALRRTEGVTEGLPPASETRLSIPALVICASNDELVDLEEARAWSVETGARFVEMKGANHFFWAQYEKLARIVADFLDDPLGD